MLKRFIRSESGATVVEYGLIVAVLSLVIVGGVGSAADGLQWLFSDNASELVKVFKQGD